MTSSSKTSPSAQAVIDAFRLSPEPRYDADEYQLTVIQAHNGELLTNQMTVARAMLRDGNEDLIAHMCRSMDHSLLDFCGHVDRGRLWGSSPVVYGEPYDDRVVSDRVHILNGPHEGEARNFPKSWDNTLYIASRWGETTYLIRNTFLGRVGIFSKQHQYRGHLYD